MWCGHCQLEVPAVAAPVEPHRVLCPRCGEPLEGTEAPGAEDEGEAAAELPADELLDPVLTEAWETDLHAVEQLLSDLEITAGTEAAPRTPAPPPLEQVSAPVAAHVALLPPASPRPRVELRTGSHWVSWLVVSLGFMLISCGGVLLGWAHWGARAELRQLGWPLALLGLAGVLVGIVLQVEALWQTHRASARSLREMNEQLERLQQMAYLLAHPQRSPGQAYYAHHAERANPQLLLAELKGQIEMLALSLAATRDSGRRAA